MSERQMSLQEWLERVRANEHWIYVRERGDTVALAELGPDRWAYHMAYWLRNGMTPVIYRGS